MNEASVDLAIQLYELTGWEGATDCWFDDRPLSDDNYPAYTLGYLLRQLACQDVRVQLSNQCHEWICLANDMAATAGTPEDAVAQLCIQICTQ